MTIEVTGCHDCPFKVHPFGECLLINEVVIVEVFANETHESCPLKQETITIKLKEDEKAKSNKEL